MKTTLLSSISFRKITVALVSLVLFSFFAKGQLPGCHAKFTFIADQPTLTVTFTDESWYDVGPQNTTWTWDFGDGNTSVEQSPVHIYSAEQIYVICLTVTNCSSMPGACCTDTYCDTIEWGKYVATSVDQALSLQEVQFFPNPFADIITIQLPASIDKVLLTDLQGNVFTVYHITTSPFAADVSFLAKGIYCLQFFGDKGIAGRRLVVKQ